MDITGFQRTRGRKIRFAFHRAQPICEKLSSTRPTNVPTALNAAKSVHPNSVISKSNLRKRTQQSEGHLCVELKLERAQIRCEETRISVLTGHLDLSSAAVFLEYGFTRDDTLETFGVGTIDNRNE